MDPLSLAAAFGVGTFLLAYVACGRGMAGLLLGSLVGALTGLAAYASLPVLAMGFYGLPALVLMASTLTGMACLLAGAVANGGGPRPGTPLALGATALAWMIAIWGGSLGAFNAATYRGIVPVEEKPLDASIELIDQSHARLVDGDLARRRALELLGSEKGLGSSYVVGDPVVQSVAGRQVWVAPLEPAGFWAWLNADAAPGYVVVSATNYSEAEIRLDKPLRYSKEAWFGRAVERHAWSALPWRAQTDHSLEIDDEGRPYWVVSLYAHVAGAAGPKVTGAMTVDAGTGETRVYELGKEPAWIDRVQPEWIAQEQLTLWGDYVAGWPNMASEGVVHPTDGMSLVQLRDGRSAWFTGIVNLRSQKANASAADGFALYDSRTGTARVYYRQGISESAAQAAMQGAVQREGYRASNPIAYSVHGALTYVSTLKDDSGNPQAIGMASALDRSVTAVGRSLDDVTRAYASRLRTATARVTSLGAEARPVTVAGTLVRSGSYVLEGKGYQLVRISVDGADRDYTVDLSVAPLRPIVLARAGDRVELAVLVGSDGVDEIRKVRVVPADARP